jgi:hypothetical protein
MLHFQEIWLIGRLFFIIRRKTKGIQMESSGQSEFSNSPKKVYSLTFWQNFFLTFAGACGLISMVADGPRWITYPSLIIVIILLLSIISKTKKK